MSSAAEPPVRGGADGEGAAAAEPVAWPGSRLAPGPFTKRPEPAAVVETAPEPIPEQHAGPSAEPPAEPSAEPIPEPTGRARFRVLTGGRAAAPESAPESASEAPAVAVDDRTDTDGVDPATPGPDFRVRCPDCGPQYVAIADVRFVSTGGGADTDRYLFTCPACGLRVRRPAGPELARILRTSGVATLALRRATDQAL